MRIFLDTSVLVAAVLQQHESHPRAFLVLDRVQSGANEGFVSAHSLAELYAVLTKLPPPFRHTAEQALLSIEENVIKHFKTVPLTATEYVALLRDAALAGILGGTIYDAVLLKCAAKAGVEKIFTLNVKHFQTVAPGNMTSEILVP